MGTQRSGGALWHSVTLNEDLTYWNGRMNVAWGLLWEENRSAKHCLFSSGCSWRWRAPRVWGGCGCFGCVCVRVLIDCFGIVADRSGMAAWLLLCFVASCVDKWLFATWCCKTHCNGCMTVAWGLLWGGSRSAKTCVFSGKVAAAGDVAQLLREAVAGTFFGSHTVTVASSCFGCVCVCV